MVAFLFGGYFLSQAHVGGPLLGHDHFSIKPLLQFENWGLQQLLWMPIRVYVDLRECFLRKTLCMVSQLDDMGYETQGFNSTHPFSHASLTCGLAETSSYLIIDLKVRIS